MKKSERLDMVRMIIGIICPCLVRFTICEFRTRMEHHPHFLSPFFILFALIIFLAAGPIGFISASTALISSGKGFEESVSSVRKFLFFSLKFLFLLVLLIINFFAVVAAILFTIIRVSGEL